MCIRKVSTMGFLAAIIWALTVLSVTLADESCPPPNQIAPCTCDREGMNCMSITSIDQIRKAFRANFKFGGIQSVWIQGTSITNVPSDLFGTTKALAFYIEMNELTTVNMKAFDSSKENLRILSFFGNKLSNFVFSSLQNFPQLAIFNLGRNEITSIPANAFSHSSLVTLILSQNHISSIGANAFKGLPNLNNLELSRNYISTLGPYSISVSPQAVGLEVHLTSNTISYIASTAFAEGSPKVLYLSYNKLTSLASNAFVDFLNRIAKNGGVVEVSGNPLTCRGCDYRWIVDNKIAVNQLVLGFQCPDGTGILGLTSSKIGC